MVNEKKKIREEWQENGEGRKGGILQIWVHTHFLQGSLNPLYQRHWADNLFCACAEHALYAKTDRGNIHGRTPILVENGEANVAVAVDVWVHRNVLTNKGHLERGRKSKSFIASFMNCMTRNLCQSLIEWPWQQSAYAYIDASQRGLLLGSKPTCGESKGYLELNLNCKTNFSPWYRVLSGPSMWIFQLETK